MCWSCWSRKMMQHEYWLVKLGIVQAENEKSNRIFLYLLIARFRNTNIIYKNPYLQVKLFRAPLPLSFRPNLMLCGLRAAVAAVRVTCILRMKTVIGADKAQRCRTRQKIFETRCFDFCPMLAFGLSSTWLGDSLCPWSGGIICESSSGSILGPLRSRPTPSTNRRYSLRFSLRIFF